MAGALLRDHPELHPFLLSNARPTGRTIGSGSFGSVEEVALPGGVCAAKKIHDFFLDPNEMPHEGIERASREFVRECQLMSTLRHPHIVQFLGVCFLPRSRMPALVMEYLLTSLHDVLDPEPPPPTKAFIPVSLKRSILHDVASGLAFLHSHTPPIIHRDLSAKNILLNPGMVAKISDLGMARLVPSLRAATMTKAPGASIYMPPEALEDKSRYDVTIDIFSIGVITIFLLSQTFPKPLAAAYMNPRRQMVGRTELERRSSYMLPILRELGGAHPLVQMIQRCLSNFPEERPTVAAVLQLLEQARAEIDDGEYDVNKLTLAQALSQKTKLVQSKDEHIEFQQQQIVSQKTQLTSQMKWIDSQKEQIDIQKAQIQSLQEQNESLQAEVAVLKQTQKVYRVIDLPPSMRPLIYDFGQLNTDTESRYTKQIVQDHTVDATTPLASFWLKIFNSQCSEEALSFANMVGRQKVPMRDDFMCEFPFSWMVKELMDSHLDNALALGGQHIHRELCNLVSGTGLGGILLSVQDGGECEELYRHYLHDFVRSVHKCTHKTEKTVKQEYQLIQDSLHNMITRGDEFNSFDGNVTLVSRIAAVHVVYRASSECIHWFAQLTSHYAGVLPGVQSIQQETGQDKCMMLHLYAVEKVLNSKLKPPLEAKRESKFTDDQTLRAWLKSVREISIAIESILSLSSEHPIARKARLQWQKIRAIQMFTEHVLLNHAKLIVYARRLNLSLGNETNFLRCSTVEKVKRALNDMHNHLKKGFGKSKDEKKQLVAIRKSCRNFFLEVVSGLCFGQSTVPDDGLVEMLLNIVFTEKAQVEGGGEEEGRLGTRVLTPYYKDDPKERDETPIIRSFLLQLLLEHNTEKVKGHLKTYFDRCQQALVGTVGEVDQDLCLLCTQCFEDAMNKEYCGQSLECRMEAIVKKKMLTSATDILIESAGFTEQTVSLDILEGVARMRYGLHVVSELLQLQVNKQDEGFVSQDRILYGRTASILIEEARRACTESRINTIYTTGEGDTTGPVVYLLKLLVRQAGFVCLNKIVQTHNWVVPHELGRDEEEKILDPFVLYTTVYTAIRKEMSDAAYAREYEGLEAHITALQPGECVPLVLSVYEVYTMSRAYTQNSKCLLPETIEKMNEMIVNCNALQRELKIMARALVSNEQGGPLAALQVSAGQQGSYRTLGALVVHVVATLFSRSNGDLFPLINLLNTPGNMAQCYLPTMGEDILPDVRKVMTGGQFYECPNGHPYFIGDCGRPYVQGTCNVCGSVIGGIQHEKAANNRDARTTDITQTGHALGHPNTRGNVPSPERSLSPAACCIVRAIMHSALLWASCNNETATEGLITLVKSGLHSPQELPEFFWGHLECDVKLLAMALGKNLDEAAIVIHLVLKNILTTNPTGNPTVAVPLRTLGTRDVRDKWEKQFGQMFIHPTLEKLEANLNNAMGAILNDDNQDHDPLFYLVYERTPVVKGTLEPHLWGYRPHITLEHLTRYMQQQKRSFKILTEFLKNEAVLQATQYIPDIVRLQRQMFDNFHHRIDSKVARTKTMNDFIKTKHTENVRNEYREMVASVNSAWSLVRDKLKDHGQLRVKDEYLQQDFKLDTPLEYFIPTTTGPGACTFSLVHYLTYVHNNFMEFCRSKTKSSWSQEHKIKLQHIHPCHLLDYHSQLQSILLSHCHYSLHVGRGSEVSYDLAALEKHILDRFIHGKPTILVDIPQVSYQKDVYTAATFEAVRKKVSPQVDLELRVQLDILRELVSPDKLRKCLDVVEIVLGFLTSGGGKPKLRLRSYIKSLKMNGKEFSEKAKEHCNLEHILSLWQTLSVGLARIITLSGQEPFHTLNHELLEELTDTQHQQLEMALPKFDLPALLGTLYEFIETYIRHIDMGKKDWGLLDVLPEMSNLKVPTELRELPDDITLAQTVALWKYIVYYQSHQRQDY